MQRKKDLLNEKADKLELLYTSSKDWVTKIEEKTY